MAKITVDPKELTRGRFAGMQEHTNGSQAYIVGLIGLFWAETRDQGIESGTEAELVQYIPVEPARQLHLLRGMLRTGYLRQAEPGGPLVIVDNVGIKARKAVYRENGRKGAQVRYGPKKAPPKPRAKKQTALVAPGPDGELVPVSTEAKKEANRATWAAYEAAYLRRMGQRPTRNAKSNALISQFVDRLGVADAPAVIEFYVSHPNAFYMERLYMLDLAVKNAESLRTQWANDRPITRAEVDSFAKNHARDMEQAEMMRMRAEARR